MLCLFWFCFTSLSDWIRKFAPLSQPIRSKTTKTNRDLFERVFPRLTLITCICFNFCLVRFVFCSCCDWIEWLLWFWFYGTHWKPLYSEILLWCSWPQYAFFLKNFSLISITVNIISSTYILLNQSFLTQKPGVTSDTRHAKIAPGKREKYLWIYMGKSCRARWLGKILLVKWLTLPAGSSRKNGLFCSDTLM